jgi:hypothetical protein
MSILAPDENEETPGQTENVPGVSAQGLTANLTPVQPGSTSSLPSGGGLIGGGGSGAGAVPTGVAPSTGATAVGGSPGSTGLNAPGTNPTASGQFANTNAYIANNQDNTTGLANNVDQFLSNTANSAESNLNNQSNSFNTAVQQGTIAQNPTLMAQEAANPTSFAAGNNGSNLTSYQNLVNGTYSGPNQFTGSEWDAASQTPINQYEQYATSAQTPNQFGTLLQAANAGSTYTSGQQNLDSLLLQNNPTAQASINNTLTNAPNLNQLYSNAETAGNTAANQGTATTQATNQAASQQVLGQENQLQSTIGSMVSQLVNTGSAQQAAITNALTNVISQSTVGTQTIPNPNYIPPTIPNPNYNPKAQFDSNPEVNTTSPTIANPKLQGIGAGLNNPPTITTTTVIPSSAGTAISPQMLQEMGLTQAQWNALLQQVTAYNTNFGALSGNLSNLSGYFTPSSLNTITASNTATPAQYSELAALNSLMGPNATPNTFINTPGSASTAQNMNLGSYNYAGNQQDVENEVNTDQQILNEKLNNQPLVAPQSTVSQLGTIGGLLSGASAIKNLTSGALNNMNIWNTSVGPVVGPTSSALENAQLVGETELQPGASELNGILNNGLSAEDIADAGPTTDLFGATAPTTALGDAGSGLGAIGGAYAGYQLGSMIGEGTGKSIAEGAGAVIGASVALESAGVPILETIATAAAAC